jgi:hypothetical protein
MALNPQNIEKHKFTPGQSGNPAGRPKGIPNAATRYQRLLKLVTKAANPVTGEMEEYTQAELMDMRIMSKALKGDLPAYKEIMDRLEGRTVETVNSTTIANTKVIIHDEARNEDAFNKQDT